MYISLFKCALTTFRGVKSQRRERKDDYEREKSFFHRNFIFTAKKKNEREFCLKPNHNTKLVWASHARAKRRNNAY